MKDKIEMDAIMCPKCHEIASLKADYEYIASHIDNDSVKSMREATSVVVRQAKEYEKLNTSLTNDSIDFLKECKKRGSCNP